MASSSWFWSLWPGFGIFSMKLTERPGSWSQKSPAGPKPWGGSPSVPYPWRRLWPWEHEACFCWNSHMYLQAATCPSKWRWIPDIQRCCLTVACWDLSMVGRVAQMIPSDRGLLSQWGSPSSQLSFTVGSCCFCLSKATPSRLPSNTACKILNIRTL